ncbi:MAG: AzlC family ABC transporter permease [Bacillota bacterium]
MLRFCFKKTIPVMFGYLFLGYAFGILFQQTGYNWVWAPLTSLAVYAGSLQFALTGLLASGASVATIAVMTLLINSRHIFYGLPFLKKFRDMGRKFPYMVFSLTDETYSVLCSCEYPEGIDEKKASFCIALLNHCYWIAGTLAGALTGRLAAVDFSGIEFSMTALFVVIFIEQWRSSKCHMPAVIGLVSGVLFLLLLGSSRFIMPSLIATVVLLLISKPIVEKKAGEEPVQ